MISLITAGPHWSCYSSCTMPRSKKCGWWVLTIHGNMHISFYWLSCIYNSFLLLSPSLFFLFCHLVQKHQNICFSPEVTFYCASMCEVLCLWYQWNYYKWQVCSLMFHTYIFCMFRGLKLSWCQWSPTFLKLSRLDDCGESMRTHLLETLQKIYLTPLIDSIKCSSSWDSFSKTQEKHLFWLFTDGCSSHNPLPRYLF